MGRREGVCVVVFVPSPADPSRDVGRECVCLCLFPHWLTPCRGSVCVVVFVPLPADPLRDVGRECLCICILLVDPLWNIGRVCDFSSVTHSLINPRRACAARVTVLGLRPSVCPVPLILALRATRRPKSDTNGFSTTLS